MRQIPQHEKNNHRVMRSHKLLTREQHAHLKFENCGVCKFEWQSHIAIEIDVLDLAAMACKNQ